MLGDQVCLALSEGYGGNTASSLCEQRGVDFPLWGAREAGEDFVMTHEDDSFHKDCPHTSMLLDIREQQGLMAQDFRNAAEQRTLLLKKIDELDNVLRGMPLLLHRMNEMEPKVKAFDDFRVRILAAEGLRKSVWAAVGGLVGGVLGAVITWFLNKH